MSVAAALLALPFAGLFLRGWRAPDLWAGAALVLGACLWRARARLATRPLVVWLPWLGWAALSAALSGQPLASLPALSRWAAALALLAAASQLWSERHRRLWAGLLLAGAPILAVAALWTGWTVLLAHGSGESMTGLLPPYYNYTAFVLAAAAAAATATAADLQPAGPARLSALFSVATLAAARARGALLALLVGAAAGAAGSRQRRMSGFWAAAGAVALALALATAAAVALRVGTLSHALKLDKAFAFKRPQLWLAAARVAADHPVLGEGPGQFAAGFRRHVFPAGYGLTQYQFMTEHAHSEPLQLAAETGVVGLLLFAGGLAAALGPAGATAGSQAALAAAAAMGAQCAVDNMLQVPALALLFFSGLACARPSKRRRPDDSGGGDGASALWGASAVLVALLALGGLASQRLLAAVSDESGAPGVRLQRAALRQKLFSKDPGGYEAEARAALAWAPPQPERALAALERACALAPFNAFDWTWRGEVLRVLGRWPEAGEVASRALAVEPDFLQARLLLAESLAAAGRRADSRTQLAELEARRARLATLDLKNVTVYTEYDRMAASCDEARAQALRRFLARTTAP